MSESMAEFEASQRDDFEPEPYDGDDNESAPSVLGPDGPRLCKEMCDTCIFRPGNQMRLAPGRVKGMVRESLRAGSFITCHSTLPQVTGKPLGAICRGFFDRYGPQSNVLRIFGRIGGFDEVDPPSIKKVSEASTPESQP